MMKNLTLHHRDQQIAQSGVAPFGGLDQIPIGKEPIAQGFLQLSA